MDDSVWACPQRERRRLPRSRYPTPPISSWLALVGPNLWGAPILNLSAEGVAFCLSHAYPVGFDISIQLVNPTTRSALLKPSRVVHCTPHDTHGWILGARFNEPFTPDELKALTPSAPAAHAPGLPSSGRPIPTLR
jgi:hypothetical protein